MKKFIIAIVAFLAFFAVSAKAVTLLSVPQGGTGAGTLTGIVVGNGTGAFTTNSTGDLTSDLNIDSNTFVVSYDDNKVGIGTATPTYALHVTGSIQTDTNFYGDTWMSSTGNSMAIQPTGDVDDFFSFKTPADRPTMKREGGKYIYIESTNVNDVGISFRKDADHSGTVNYYKDENLFGMTSKDPLVFKVCADYDDYVKICAASNVPEMTIVGAADFKINAGGSNALLLNHAGGNVAVGATSTGYILGLGTGDTFGIGTTQWNSADEIDGTKIKDADYGDVVIDVAGDWQVSEGEVDHDSLLNFVANEHLDWTADLGATNIHSGNYTDNDTTYPYAINSVGVGGQVWKSDGVGIGGWGTDNNTTYTSSDFTHDDLTGFVANEHLDWTGDLGAVNIHAGNYTDTNTTYLGGTNLTLAGTTFNVDDSFVINSGSDIIGGGSGFTWTFNASAGTDSVFTFGDGIANLSTGALQVGGSAVLTGNETITLSGDVTGSGATAITTTIGADKILESHLKAVDAAADEECLTYEATTGDFEWQACGGSLAINDITDITIDTPADNEVLAYNNGTSTWLNQTPAEAGLQGVLTNSAGLLAALSDETGTGVSVFSTSPTFTTPLLGTPTSGVLTNCTGTASGLTAGNVTTNANLTGEVTSTGNASLVADNIIDEANLKVNAPTNDHVLTADSGEAGGMKWAAGFADPMTTRGDIIYKDSSNATTRLGVGTADQVLTSDGTDISWAAAGGGGGDVGGLYGINVETLSADKTLTVDSNKIYQYLDEGGANRIITLATAGASAGDRFVIRHNGGWTDTHYLRIQQSTTFLDSIYSGGIKEFIFDGTNWRSGENGTGENDSKTNNTSIGSGSKAYYGGLAVGKSSLGTSYSVGIGNSAQATDQGVAIGEGSRGNYKSVAIGYSAKTENLRYSVALGYYSVNKRYSEIAKNIDGSSTQDYNMSSAGWAIQTANATPVEMFLGEYSNQRFTINPESSVSFVIRITARDNVANEVASYKVEGLIKRDGASNTVLSWSSKTVQYEDDASWDVAVTADDTNEALIITVTGDGTNPVRFAGRIDEVETQF